MYAVIKTGGKQYRVEEGDLVKVEKLEGESGEAVVIDQVLMIGKEGDYKVGKPFVENAKVEAVIAAQDRHPKIKVFHFKRRKNYRKLNGHRQPFTELKINSIIG